MKRKTFERVYDLVLQIPKGKVSTYGAIGRFLGINPRIVGYALHANNRPGIIPCHRVINSEGAISSGFAFGGPFVQKTMIEKEGVKFGENGKVDLNIYGYFLFS